jgi:chromosome segregation ATPase
MTAEPAALNGTNSPGIALTWIGDAPAMSACLNCGRPIPQPAQGRPIRYCPDNDGACEQAAHERRDRARGTTGLPGQVAWTWEIVERLEGMADELVSALSGELSVAGVERRIAEAKAEAAASVASAQEAADMSHHQAEIAWQEAQQLRIRAETAEAQGIQDRERAELVAAECENLRATVDRAQNAAAEANAARVAAESERDRTVSREAENLLTLEALRNELADVRTRLSETQSEIDGQRAAAHVVRREAEAANEQLEEQRRYGLRLSQSLEEMQTALAALAQERDAARAEADRARSQIDSLAQSALSRRMSGANGVNGPMNGYVNGHANGHVNGSEWHS